MIGEVINLSAQFVILNDVRQGGTCSSWVFNSYLYDVIRYLGLATILKEFCGVLVLCCVVLGRYMKDKLTEMVIGYEDVTEMVIRYEDVTELVIGYEDVTEMVIGYENVK